MINTLMILILSTGGFVVQRWIEKAVQQEKTWRKTKTERKFNGSSCLLYSADKRIDPVASTALFCKSDSWENFLNPLIKLSSFFSAPYILGNSQSLYLLTNIFAAFIPMAKWSEVGKIAMAWNKNNLKNTKASEAPKPSRHVPSPV